MKIILRANVPTERWLFACASRGTTAVALRQVATGFLRSHPLPSGGQLARKPPPSGDWWLPSVLRSHPLPSGGRRARKPPPSGDRWLLATGGYRASYVAIRCQAVVVARENLHRLATGGYWRQVATGFLRSHPLPSGGRRARKPPPSGDRWLPQQVATASTQAMGPRSLYPVPTSDAEIASDGHARHILHHPVNQGLRRCPLQARTPDHPKGDGRQKQGGF